MTAGVLLSLVVGLAAAVVWFVLLVRNTVRMARHLDTRRTSIVMPLVGFVAALGAASSGVGFAIRHGLDLAVDTETLDFLAGMGRGALLLGGIIVWFHPAVRDRRS